MFAGVVLAGAALLLPSSLLAESPAVAMGRELFERQWSYDPLELPEQGDMLDRDFEMLIAGLRGDGLGPMHNARSCADCHAGGGAAGVDRNVTLMTLDPRNAFVTDREAREATRSQLIELYPGLLSPFGVVSMDVVVHDHSSRPFYDAIRAGIARHVSGGIPVGWYDAKIRTTHSVAQRPVLAGRSGGIDFYLSQRNSPPLFGLGLIDKVSVSDMRSKARIQKRRTRGRITGRVGAGKFGWRAQTPTLDQFVRGACSGELGLQTAGTPQSADLADETYTSLGVDMSPNEVQQLVSFVRSLPPPIQETRLPKESVASRDGRLLFDKIGCSDCHVANLHPVRNIYSDLLLHDMGELLQAPSPAPLGPAVFTVHRMSLPRFAPDRQPLGSRRLGSSIGGYYGSPSNALPSPYAMARPIDPKFPRGSVPGNLFGDVPAEQWTWDRLQREWRTPPLWGVADSAPYLHDGRAETLDAAILWHGGEADDSAEKYRSLSLEKRRAVIAFLVSLRAPASPARAPARSVSEQMVASTRLDFQESSKSREVEELSVFTAKW